MSIETPNNLLNLINPKINITSNSSNSSNSLNDDDNFINDFNKKEIKKHKIVLIDDNEENFDNNEEENNKDNIIIKDDNKKNILELNNIKTETEIKTEINKGIIEEGEEEENIEEYKLSGFIFYDEFIKKYPNYLKFDPNFPNSIKITTSTLIITYPLEFNIKNIADKIKLSNNFIVSIKYGNSTSYYRTIKKEIKKKVYSKQKKLKNKKERKRKNFYNHVSLEIDNKREDIKLNIKIFQNKSLQITGLKKLSWLFWALYNLFNYMNFKSNDILFASPLENIQLNKMEKFFIVMFNCIFNVNFKINLNNLFYTIKNNYNYKVHFDSGKHCALNITYNYDLGNNKSCDVSVIIYNNGKILMSAKENYEVVMKCYKDISLLLFNHYDDIFLENYIINKNSITNSSINDTSINDFNISDYDNNNDEEYDDIDFDDNEE